MSSHAIILVDDEKTILDCLHEQLGRMFGTRYIYERAESVDEAWEVIIELEEDGVEIVAVISDWLMPGTRGDEFLIGLRARRPATARVMLTGQADGIAIDRVRREGDPTTVMAKPWSAEALERVLVEAIAA
jgi:CheY-like chemotaxis protein